jgi:hypothetical protein
MLDLSICHIAAIAAYTCQLLPPSQKKKKRQIPSFRIQRLTIHLI